MKAVIKTHLNTSAGHAWHLIKQSSTLIYVCKGLLNFSHSDTFPSVWEINQTITTRLKFFGVMPAWQHTLHFKEISEKHMRLLTQEHGGIVSHWQHEIHVSAIDDDHSLYTDSIEIRAGIFTPLVWLFAQCFYRYRQRRWHQLLRSAELTRKD